MVEVKYVVAALAGVLVLSVAGIVLLAYVERPIPDVLQNLAVGSLTALAGVLVPVRSSGGTATPDELH